MNPLVPPTSHAAARSASPLLPPFGLPSVHRGETSVSLMDSHTDAIRESHERCQGFGLTHRDRLDFSAEALADFKVAQERCARLQAQALPVMEMLLDQVAGTSNVVCLADDKGTILMSAGRGSSIEFAERVALRPGVSWAEAAKGTNAVGTALVAESDVFVHANEHFVQSNQILTCAASPIMDHSGGVIGVLDVTGDQHAFHPHTMALVKVAARTIENYWFCDNFSRNLRLHFHSQPELIGTMVEGVIALGADGKILGINRAGLKLLGASSAAVRIQGLRVMLGLSFGELMDRLRTTSLAPFKMHLPSGQVLYARGHCSNASFAPLFSFNDMHPSQDTAHAPHLASGLLKPSGSASETSTLLAHKLPKAPNGPELNDLAKDDAQMRAVVDKVRRVLDRDIPVLILGDTGTGKEFLACALHQASQRREHAFVAVNCASIPETLIESELFGYEEGAFTGAKRRGAPGKLLQAHGGTLFLDEIGDMPLAMQARLLRVLQERKVVPLGGHKAHDVDISLVCATHRNLREMMEQGQFREDLYYRINGLAVKLPRLCERTDLRALCQQLLKTLSPNHALRISDDLLLDFEDYTWPGNLRQLHNVLRTATVMAGTDQQITRIHLSDDFVEDLVQARYARKTVALDSRQPTDTPVSTTATAFATVATAPGRALQDLELESIRNALQACKGNVSLAAKQLNISRNTIYRKLKPSAIDVTLPH